MQVILSGKGIELTEAIKEYAEKKISSLEKFYDQIIRAHVTVGVETHHHLKGKIFVCECKLEIPGNDLFASKEEATLYKAIDKVRDYLELEIGKHKAKFHRHDRKDHGARRDTKEYQP